jgi:hypothetical protein
MIAFPFRKLKRPIFSTGNFRWTFNRRASEDHHTRSLSFSYVAVPMLSGIGATSFSGLPGLFLQIQNSRLYSTCYVLLAALPMAGYSRFMILDVYSMRLRISNLVVGLCSSCFLMLGDIKRLRAIFVLIVLLLSSS